MSPPLSTGQSGALVTAVEWVAGLLTGSLGESIAVLAIAALGFALLQGRVPVRRAATVVLGCFILFGARTVAAGLMGLGGGSPGGALAPAAAPAIVAAPHIPPPSPFDPYAGASVPQ